jgi:beta-lactamase regulating signal transducer with metallopeptidase domain
VTDPRTRLTRALLLAAASVVLVALIAVAAGGYRLNGSNSAHASPYAIDTILSIVIALYIIAAVAVIVAMFWSGLELRRAQRQRPRAERIWRTILLLLVAAVLVVVAAQRYRLHAHPRAPNETPAAGKASKSGHDKKGGAHKRHQAHIRLVPMLAFLGAGGIAVAAFLLAENRRRRRLPSDWHVAEALSDVLDETLDDLRAESDPRRAVIAAYARMERSLAAHGLPRRRFEAPHEYLGRVLAEVSGGGPAARRLTALFERARFSPHEIDAAMKDEAIEAIESLQAELAAAAVAEAA